MKQAGYTKRPYGRSPERPRQSHTKQSNSPSSSEGKMRGNPQQCVDKYLTLARDATSLGDPISAENYYQYADHYYRLVAATRVSRPPQPTRRIEDTRSDSHSPSEFVQDKPIHVPTQSENWLE
jgi:hypothetical protein